MPRRPVAEGIGCSQTTPEMLPRKRERERDALYRAFWTSDFRGPGRLLLERLARADPRRMVGEERIWLLPPPRHSENGPTVGDEGRPTSLEARVGRALERAVSGVPLDGDEGSGAGDTDERRAKLRDADLSSRQPVHQRRGLENEYIAGGRRSKLEPHDPASAFVLGTIITLLIQLDPAALATETLTLARA